MAMERLRNDQLFCAHAVGRKTLNQSQVPLQTGRNQVISWHHVVRNSPGLYGLPRNLWSTCQAKTQYTVTTGKIQNSHIEMSERHGRNQKLPSACPQVTMLTADKAISVLDRWQPDDAGCHKFNDVCQLLRCVTHGGICACTRSISRQLSVWSSVVYYY